LAIVDYSERALRDFERIVEFLNAADAPDAAAVVAQIADAISVLQRHPCIGRPAEHGMHELVVGHGKAGYVALYRYFEAADQVLVLALRHQREAGYP
jgi:plasmid stabilization system protein ParE